MPTRVDGAASTDLYTQASGGDQHGLGLRPDGSLWAWGNNYYVQLGNGTVGTVSGAALTPGRVGTALYTQVAAGYSSGLARQADGTLWSWGDNYYGQLGQGLFGVPRSFPAQEITLNTSWTTLAAGSTGFHALAHTASGPEFASTGKNDLSQLGDGTLTQANRFDRVAPLSSFQPLPVPAAALGTAVVLYPSPTSHGAAQLSGATPGALVRVLDAMGRQVASATADAVGTAALALPMGTPAGVYVVRADTRAVRLVVE